MTVQLTHVKAPEGVAPGTGHSHVVWGTGRFVAISGQCAFDEDGKVVGEDDPAEIEAFALVGEEGQPVV